MGKHHGLMNTGAYSSWLCMRQRCRQKSLDSYRYYGARGISFCERWNDFLNFYADMGERPEGNVLDRIDVNGNYEPGNCRWITISENANNKRVHHRITFSGMTKTIAQWSDFLGIKRGTLQARIKRGWELKDIFEKKATRGRKQKDLRRGMHISGRPKRTAF